MHAPPPDLAGAASAVLTKPQTDPMSFPPGLIPQLVAEKLTTDPPYSPLSPLDIDQAGLPSTSEPDSYLQSRIDRFYAELQVIAADDFLGTTFMVFIGVRLHSLLIQKLRHCCCLVCCSL